MLSAFFISVLISTITVAHSYTGNSLEYRDRHLNILAQPSDKQPLRMVNLLDKLRNVNVIKRRLEMTSNLIPFGWGPGGRRLTRGEMRLYGCLLAVRDRIRRDDRGCNEVLPALVANTDESSSIDHMHNLPRM